MITEIGIRLDPHDGTIVWCTDSQVFGSSVLKMEHCGEEEGRGILVTLKDERTVWITPSALIYVIWQRDK